MDEPQNPEWQRRGPIPHDDRLHAGIAGAQRAVGGALTLVRELGRISEHLDPSVPASWINKRALFFTYELQSLVDASLPERDRLLALNKFFFEEKRFSVATDPKLFADPTDGFKLQRVLTDRVGQPLVLAMLYNLMAERLGLQLEIVDFKPSFFLKWVEQGHARFIDLTRAGATLSSDELIELLNSRFEVASTTVAQSLETLTFESFMTRYVSDLKAALVGSGSRVADQLFERLLFLQNILIAYQPSNINWIGERAFLNRKLGNFKNALSDLKRYFAFNERERAPSEFGKLYDELLNLVRQPGEDPSKP